MRRIVVIHRKGGCGKTTVSTNLASFYASKGMNTALFQHALAAAAFR
jgi:chromosome partitioning protein